MSDWRIGEPGWIWRIPPMEFWKLVDDSRILEDNPLGYPGVTLLKGKWEARTGEKNPKFLGRFDGQNEAIRARKEWEKKTGFKPRPGLKMRSKGVSFFRGKWAVQVMRNRKRVYLGRFDTELEGAAAIEKWDRENAL
jgi:hypothetical protein